MGGCAIHGKVVKIAREFREIVDSCEDDDADGIIPVVVRSDERPCLADGSGGGGAHYAATLSTARPPPPSPIPWYRRLCLWFQERGLSRHSSSRTNFNSEIQSPIPVLNSRHRAPSGQFYYGECVLMVCLAQEAT